jgi:hypothetical protein
MDTTGTNTKRDLSKIIDYFVSFDLPAELHLMTPKDKANADLEVRRLDATRQYTQSIIQNPDLGGSLDKDVMEGKIYGPSQAANIRAKILALEGTGARTDIKRSIVIPTGQAVIMSEACASALGFIADGFVVKDDMDQLIQILRNEQVEESQIKRVQEAGQKYGAIILQRGSYVALKGNLEEAAVFTGVRSSFEEYQKNLNKTPQSNPASESPRGVSLSALKDRLVKPLPAIPPAPPKPSGPAMTPAEIRRELATKELTTNTKPTTPKPVPPVPKFTPPPVPAPAVSPKLISTPSMGLPSLRDIKVIEDLKKVEPAHLRQGYLPEQVKIIRTKIAYLAGVNKILPINVVNVFEQSPLFKLYIRIGSSIISQSTNEKKADYKQVIAVMVNNGADVLSLAEFEAVADLRKDLERM